MATPEVTTRPSLAQGPCRTLTFETRKRHKLKTRLCDELRRIFKADPDRYDYDEPTDMVRMRSDEEISLLQRKQKLEERLTELKEILAAFEADLSKPEHLCSARRSGGEEARP